MNNQEIRVGIRKEVFDEMITSYGKDNHSLRGAETLDVKDVSMEEDIVIIKAELSEGTVQ